MKLIEKILEVRKEEKIIVGISNIVGYIRSEDPKVCISLSYLDADGMLLVDKSLVSVSFPEDTIIEIIDERVEILKKRIGERFKGRILQDLKNLKEECKDLIVEVTDEDSD